MCALQLMHILTQGEDARTCCADMWIVTFTVIFAAHKCCQIRTTWYKRIMHTYVCNSCTHIHTHARIIQYQVQQQLQQRTIRITVHSLKEWPDHNQMDIPETCLTLLVRLCGKPLTRSVALMAWFSRCVAVLCVEHSSCVSKFNVENCLYDNHHITTNTCTSLRHVQACGTFHEVTHQYLIKHKRRQATKGWKNKCIFQIQSNSPASRYTHIGKQQNVERVCWSESIWTAWESMEACPRVCGSRQDGLVSLQLSNIWVSGTVRGHSRESWITRCIYACMCMMYPQRGCFVYLYVWVTRPFQAT
jgi:hypothetical protein